MTTPQSTVVNIKADPKVGTEDPNEEKVGLNPSVEEGELVKPPLTDRIRARCKYVIDHPGFLLAIAILVLLDLALFILDITNVTEDIQDDMQYITISIAGIFTLEHAIKLFIFQWSYFKDKFMLVDGLVVVASLIVEIVVDADAGGAIVLLRLVRVFRIVFQVYHNANKMRMHLGGFGEKSALETALTNLRSLSVSGQLTSLQMSQVEDIIKLLANGKLYETKMQFGEEVMQDEQLAAFLNNYGSKSPRVNANNDFDLQTTEIDNSTVDDEKSVLSMTYIVYDQSMNALANIADWDWDIFALDKISSHNSLSVTAYHIYQDLGLVKRFGINQAKLRNFLEAIQSGYRDSNPYHNALHGGDVMHATYWFLKTGGMKKKYGITDLEMFAAVTAAVVHDLDHPGVNNVFLNDNKSWFSINYNDKSVLENHHIAAAFRVASRPDCNIFERFSDDQAALCRDLMVNMVLATDMAKHASELTEMKAKIASSINGDFPSEEFEDRRKILELALHCADISGSARPQAINHQWVHRVMEEFYRQGDLEKSIGLKVNYDRTIPVVAKCQVGFIKFFVKPFLDSFLGLTLEDASIVLTHLDANFDYWSGVAPDIEWLPDQVEGPELVEPPPLYVSLNPGPGLTNAYVGKDNPEHYYLTNQTGLIGRPSGRASQIAVSGTDKKFLAFHHSNSNKRMSSVNESSVNGNSTTNISVNGNTSNRGSNGNAAPAKLVINGSVPNEGKHTSPTPASATFNLKPLSDPPAPLITSSTSPNSAEGGGSIRLINLPNKPTS